MLLLLKLLRGVLKAIVSSAAPWQIALGALFGVLLGFLPLFPGLHGPAPLGWIVLLAAIAINCHFGSVLVWMLFGMGLAKLLVAPLIMLGNGCDGLARASADIGLLHASLWSDTYWLGRSLAGLVLAPLAAIFMWWFTVWFRTRLLDRIKAQRKLALAGKITGNPIGFKLAVWFFGIV